MNNNLLSSIKSLKKSPGVYQFVDKDGDILYVGKAKNLKNRVRSYFAKELNRGPAIDQMLIKAFDIKILETESEIEALLLESELIKKLQPKYNSISKDDKSFYSIKITSDEFSKVEIIRSGNLKKVKKSETIFGPYTSALALKKSLRYLRKIFPYRDCSEAKFRLYQKRDRACLYGDINICTAPCVGKIAKTEYRKNINYLKNFLRGRKKEIISSLNKEMKLFSKNKKFEKAAEIRNQLNALEHIREVAIGISDDFFDSSKIIFQRIECFDISNISGQYSVGAMSVIIDGKIDKSEYRKFKIKTVSGANDIQSLQEIVRRRLKNDWPMPNLIVIDGGAVQLRSILNVLAEKKLSIPVIAIAKGEKRNKNELHFSSPDVGKIINSTENIKMQIIIARNEAHRFAISYYRSLHRKALYK